MSLAPITGPQYSVFRPFDAPWIAVSIGPWGPTLTKTPTESELYELLVRDVYQALVDQTLVTSVTVQHDVLLKGSSGAEHQIDVYWEYESAGFRHRVCIDAKHHGRPCDKDVVGAFQSKVEDIGKDVKGILVALNGFQSGAIALAKSKGIGLQRATWLLREVVLDLELLHDPRSFVHGINPIFDKKGVSAILQAAGLDGYQFKLQTDNRSEFLTHIESGTAIGPWGLVDLASLPRGLNRISASGYGLMSEVGLLPLEAIELDMMPRPGASTQTSVIVNGDRRAEVEDVIDGWVRTLMTDGKLVENAGQPGDAS